MPLRGVDHSDAVRGEAPYFKCLADLDDWSDKPHRKLDGTIRYVARQTTSAGAGSGNRGKLLVNIDSRSELNGS